MTIVEETENVKVAEIKTLHDREQVVIQLTNIEEWGEHVDTPLRAGMMMGNDILYGTTIDALESAGLHVYHVEEGKGVYIRKSVSVCGVCGEEPLYDEKEEEHYCPIHYD